MNRKAELSFIKYCNDNNLEKVQAYLTLAEDLEVDINAVDDDGDSAAHWGARNGHTEVTRILAATGLVDWNKRNNYGCTPLHVALVRGHFEVAGIIMEQDNIDFSLKTTSGWTVAMAAVRGGSTRSVELLAEREDCDCWNIPDNDGDTPLIRAIARKKKVILRVLLNCPRVDPNLKDRSGDSPVMKAIKNEETAMARMLIQCPRVDLATRDSNGASLEKIARENGLSEVCDLIGDVKDARIRQLEVEKSDQEARIKQLQEEKFNLSRSQQEKIPECPVCLDQFRKDQQIFSCPFGHHICRPCKGNIKVCPKCKRPLGGRDHDFENLVSDLWG